MNFQFSERYVEKDNNFSKDSDEDFFQMAAASDSLVKLVMPEQTNVKINFEQPPVWFDNVMTVTFYDLTVSNFELQIIDRQRKVKKHEVRSKEVSLEQNLYQITLEISIESLLDHKYRLFKK